MSEEIKETMEDQRTDTSEVDQKIEQEAGNFLAEESKDEQIQALEQAVEKFRKESEEFKDSWTRERAEFQNYKRRIQNEFAVIKREAVKGIATSLLNPLDNMERVTAVDKVSDEMKPFLDGVMMIYKEIQGILEKESIKRIVPDGEPFDPSFMEAIASEESEEVKEETVMEVYQAGYAFEENDNRFVLRPARVRVGKPKA